MIAVVGRCLAGCEHLQDGSTSEDILQDSAPKQG